jgi:hypothetical protein
MVDLELLNANGLDESISNAVGNNYSSCCGANGENFSNGDAGEAAKKVGEFAKENPELVKQVATIGAGLIKKKSKSEIEQKIKSVCGRKPIGVLSLGKAGKQRREKYQTCAQNVLKSETKTETAPPPPPPPSGERLAPEKEESGKFLGMPKAVGITVAVVGGLALIVGGIFLVKKLRK